MILTYITENSIHLGPDLSRVEAVYRNGVLVEGMKKPQTQREREDARVIIEECIHRGVVVMGEAARLSS